MSIFIIFHYFSVCIRTDRVYSPKHGPGMNVTRHLAAELSLAAFYSPIVESVGASSFFDYIR